MKSNLICKLFGHSIKMKNPHRFRIKCKRCKADCFDKAIEMSRKNPEKSKKGKIQQKVLC